MGHAASRFADSTQCAGRARTPSRAALGVLLCIATLLIGAAPASAEINHPLLTDSFGADGTAGTSFGGARQLAFDQAGNRLYALSSSPNEIHGFDVSVPGTYSPLSPTYPLAVGSLGDSYLSDLAVDNSALPSAGNIILATNEGNRVFAYNSAGVLQPGFPFELESGGSNYLTGAGVAPNGDIWVGNFYPQVFERFSPSGSKLSSVSTEGAGGGYPHHPAFDSAGNAYISSYYLGDTWKYTAASNYATKTQFDPGSTRDVDVDRTTNQVYVLHQDSVSVYTQDGALIETFAAGISSNFNGIAVDEATETVFVGDAEAGKIRVFPAMEVPKVTTGDPVGNNEATGSADPDGAGDITECFFEFGPDTSYGSTQNCAESLPISGETTVHALLPGMIGEKTYHYRLVVGTGAPGGTRRGSDKTITPHWVPAIETEPASNLGRATATLNASFNGNGEDHEYYFEWGLTPSYDHQTTPEEMDLASGPTDIASSISGLAVATTYHYRVIISNGLGESVGPDRTFTTALSIKDLSTTAATNVTTTTATLNGSLDPDGLETTYYFRYGRSAQYGQLAPLSPASVADSSPGAQVVSADVAELEPGAIYHYRIVATNSTGTTTATNDMTFETPQAPSVDSLTSAHVSADGAELIATINPHGEEATYRFEYGKTPAYGSVEPVPDGVLAAGNSGEKVTVQLTGLDRVLYHFRVVAESKWGTTVTPDQTFAFDPSECPNSQLRQRTGAGYLPDCRAYELVSPESMGGVDLLPYGPTSAVATNPSRFAYAGYFGTIEGTGEPQGVVGDLYIATRSTSGWTSRYVGIRGNEGAITAGPPTTFGGGGPDGIRADLSLGRVLDWDNGQQGFVCCGAIGSMSPFMWDARGEFLGRFPTGIEDIPNGTADLSKGGFVGDMLPSADFSHYFFSSNNVSFTAGGKTVGPGSAYDNNLETGEITLISKTPQGEDIPRDAGSDSEYIRFPAASTDGSHVVMSTVAPQEETHLYMAVDASEFFDVSVNESEENVPARFEGMTPDGETVYFSSREKVTADDTDTSRDLYRWQVGSPPSVTRISTGTGETSNRDDCSAFWISKCGVATVDISSIPNEFSQAKVQPTDNAIAAETGEVYFYSPELLDNGKGSYGERNLYVYRDGQPRFVTTFTGGRIANRIQITPDGGQVAFVTAEKLTPYENAGFREMYTYEPATRNLRCVSCIPDGTSPTSHVEGSQHGIFMTDDGRVFFATRDGLVERDANNGWDVYEFVESRPQLISTGTADRDEGRVHVGLMGVSADGVDVYFSTLDTMVPQDRNGAFYKFYDARTNGGFPFEVPPAPCVAADECHGPSSSAPAPPTMGTSAHLGDGGNSKSVKKKRKAKKKAKKKRRQKTRRKHGRRGQQVRR